MFGKASFNKIKFNITSPIISLYVNMRAAFSASAERLSALMDIGNVSLSAAYSTDSDLLFAKVPITDVDVTAEFDFDQGNPGVKVPIGEVSVHSEFEMVAPSLRDDLTEEFSLQDVLLAPGDTMIIDTDKLEIQVNDDNLLEAWVSGGVFFQLKPGSNTIQFFTSPTTCELTVTIFWADRYL